MSTRAQSTRDIRIGLLDDRLVALLLDRRRNAADDQRHHRRDEGVGHAQRADAVDPHHCRGGVAHDAEGAARVGGRDDPRDVADMDFALEQLQRHRPADQGRRDVVEEARDEPDDGQQEEGALPVVGQQRRHHIGNAALLEVAREQRKAHQQQEQVRQHHPFVLHMLEKSRRARTGLEAGESELVGGDGEETDERHVERLVVEKGDSKQRQREQDEVDGDAGDHDRLGHLAGGGGKRWRQHGEHQVRRQQAEQ